MCRQAVTSKTQIVWKRSHLTERKTEVIPKCTLSIEFLENIMVLGYMYVGYIS